MPKYDEIRETFISYQDAWINYRNRAYKNLGALVEGFHNYCEMPVGYSELTPLDEKAVEGRTYGVGAIHFNKDGYWHLGMTIKLTDTNRALIAICLRESDGKLLVKRGPDDEPREIDLANQRQCDDFYESIVERVKQYYLARMPHELKETPQAATEPIGFRMESS